jgi:Type I phosphodiesterase / nucleotide pyrophosphatase
MNLSLMLDVFLPRRTKTRVHLCGKKTRITFWLLVFSIVQGFAFPIFAQIPEIKHVVIIGCDGLTPGALLLAKTPNIDELKSTGAYTLQAKAVIPTVSAPNWASLLMGASPKQHGANKNGWKPHRISPKACGGITKGFPSIYSILSEQRPEMITAMFSNWEGLIKLVENEKLDELKKCKNSGNCVKNAVQYLQEKHPQLLFVYLDLIDEAGHQSGYGSKEYIKAIEKADRMIGEVRKGLEKAGILKSTAIFVVSDHGGSGKSHGSGKKEDVEIPWILSGAGILQGKELSTKVNIYDTAATIAYIFGLTPPVCWIGTPVKEAFPVNENLDDFSPP